MKPFFLLKLFSSIIFLSVLLSCTENEIIDNNYICNNKPATRSIQTSYFDWENIDWMPTPSMQSRIPTPWSGQGSLVSSYGLDISQDRKAYNGWELLYSSFDENASSPLINPYFILYNKYNGIMRVYLYITTPFVTASSYIQDGISVMSRSKTSILNYLGKDVVDIDKECTTQYMQMQPKPLDGSLPLASNRWYMLQYELAYDPNIADLPYNDIMFGLTLNYYNIQEISLGGDFVGSLNGTIGNASSAGSNMFSSLLGLGKTVGIGALAFAGNDFINHNTINAETGANKLGLRKEIFKTIKNGLSSALSGAVGDLPDAAFGLLSGIIGGGSAPTPISMTVKADINLKGTGKEGGAFPSTPISFWMPGTNIPSQALGYIPLYNKSLGVFYIKQKPVVVFDEYFSDMHYEVDPQYGDVLPVTDYFCVLPKNLDFSDVLIINPYVKDIANVEIVKMDLLDAGNGKPILNTSDLMSCGSQDIYYSYGPSLDLLVRYTVKISPKDGSTPFLIFKTFAAKSEFRDCPF